MEGKKVDPKNYDRRVLALVRGTYGGARQNILERSNSIHDIHYSC